MNQNWGYSDDIIDQGYKSLRKGVFLIGAFLTTLAVLIFAFPTLIAFIIAFFILFAGVSALVMSYRIWKLKDQARPIEWEDASDDTPFQRDAPGRVHRRRITFIMR